MDTRVNIYALIDPITCKIRYIGRTKNNLNIRLRGHISKSRFKKTYKDCWIFSLKQQNLKPKIKLIKVINGWSNSHLYEQCLIKKALNFGFKLVNLDDRGEGAKNKIITENQKILISNALKDGYSTKRIVPTNTRSVCIYDLLGNKLYTINSIKECALFLNIHESSVETQVYGKVKRCGKYQIRYAEDKNPGIYKISRDYSFAFKEVTVLNTITSELIIYESFKQAAFKLNTSSPTIRRKIESGELLNGIYKLCLNIKKSDKLLESPEEGNQQPI